MVIGISAYKNAPVLTNPANDARAIGDGLRRLKFDVVEVFDPDYRMLNDAIRDFGIRAATAEAAVVYYAGHGVQVERENYMIPADARLERERDLVYEAVSLDKLLGEVAQATKIGIVMLDSCRNNPFVDKVARSMNVAGRAVTTLPGMARMDNVPRNTMVVMAAKADQIAEDGQQHSPFAAAILAHLQLQGLELGLFFRSVRDTVLRATHNRQEPYVFSSLGAEPFYFNPRPTNRPPEIGAIHPLEVPDSAGPTPLGLPQPTDPDQDPLTIRIVSLPRSGDISVNGHPAVLNQVVTLDQLPTARYRPDGKTTGPVGALDLLIEDGRGGSVTASLPIIVAVSHHPPIVGPPRRVRITRQPLEIPMPKSSDQDPLTVTIETLPRGVVFNGDAVLRPGDHVTPNELARLSFMPEAAILGQAGTLHYRVENTHGDRADSTVDIEVAKPDDLSHITDAGDAQRPPVVGSSTTPKPPTAVDRDALLARLVAQMPPTIAGSNENVRRYLDDPGSKAMAISLEGHQSWRVFGLPTAVIARERALEGCQVRFGEPCALLAQDDLVISAPSVGDWYRADMPRTRFNGNFDPAQIPAVTDTVRSGSVVAAYPDAPPPKAMAFHPWGRVFAVTGAASQVTAEEQALSACNDDEDRKGKDGPCFLYAVGQRVVLPRRLKGADPYSRITDAARIVRPFAYEPAYSNLPDKKALAMHVESGRTFYWSNLETQALAEQLALEGCQQQFGDPCILLATGEDLRATNPRTAPHHDMERLHYHGAFNVDKVPFLRPGPDLRQYPTLPGSKAVAVRPEGARAIIVSGATSMAEAQRQALSKCNADKSAQPCFLYASGNQVILPERRIQAPR